MKLATWNVNSIRARKAQVLGWLESEAPDVLCLQETKVADDDFPVAEIEDLGYRSVVWGQPAYNGVAILSRDEPTSVTRGFGPDEDGDEQARVIAATVAGVRVYCVYIPNGEGPGSPKYAYKMKWIEDLLLTLERDDDPGKPLAICGDFNVAPADRDVHNPAVWHDRIMCTAGERERLEALMSWGLRDGFRLVEPGDAQFSWWDYRLGAFKKNRGLRIDLILLTEPLASRVRAASIDRSTREGKGTSDHAPVIVELD